jgi:branched-chain amino acid transport system ATP-binding protein
MLKLLQVDRGKTIIIAEQNVKKGLEFADVGCVLVSGRIAIADETPALLQNPDIAALFLGG